MPLYKSVQIKNKVEQYESMKSIEYQEEKVVKITQQKTIEDFAAISKKRKSRVSSMIKQFEVLHIRVL